MLGLPKRLDICANFKKNGGKIAAVLPIHYPRELLRAFNILPVEVWGPPNIDMVAGSIHLQEYICSIAHSALSFLQSKSIEVIDLIITPHACDSLQDLGSLLIDFITPDKPVFPIYIPRGKRTSDIDFLANELEILYKKLSDFTGILPSDSDLMSSITREEEADTKLKEFYKERYLLHLTNREFYEVVRLREYVPAEDFINILDNISEMVYSKSVVSGGIPLLMSGIVPEPMEVFDIISNMDAVVVADDFACIGRRLYKTGNSNNPFKRMAERIIFAPPDSTRGNPINERLEHLVSLSKAFNAKGIIFYIVKFCEPELFDLPQLRESLKVAGLPSISIEVDINVPISHQVVTRIEAFIESLK
jgi:benzoyl-CoA reductase/2-hydroxyglutaryl-CoA dehydratase subunit BcrC/BadD/HgdB